MDTWRSAAKTTATAAVSEFPGASARLVGYSVVPAFVEHVVASVGAVLRPSSPPRPQLPLTTHSKNTTVIYAATYTQVQLEGDIVQSATTAAPFATQRFETAQLRSPADSLPSSTLPSKSKGERVADAHRNDDAEDSPG